MTPPHRRSLIALDALNAVLADVRDGLGPYLAIYLVAVRGPSHGWSEASAGAVMTIAGIAGLIAQAPAGGLVDRVHAKRALLIAAAVAVTLSAVSLPLVEGFALVTIGQSIAAIAAAVFAPAIAAISLGIVGPKLFTRRIGRNEAFNHAGNAVSAGLAGVLAFSFGPQVVFWLMALFALLSIGATLIIDPKAIDHRVARGMGEAKDERPPQSLWQTLRSHPAIAAFAGACFLFHLSNAAMLPTVGQQLARIVGSGSATSLIAACIVGAQVVMIPVALIVGARTDRWGRKPLFLAAFAMLTLRGLLYPLFDAPAWLLGVQLLDGIGAGIFGALFPIIIADLTRGTGRFNVAQGAVATVQGLGGALSTSLAGAIVVWAGFGAAFVTLAAVAAIGLVFFAIAIPETRGRLSPA
ncbi:MFS transporter [Sphingomonas sp. Y38-1Y]|uniref:MFS transporter n=1 Tax=Sphingomonas sp. Y38-1Y TaxID=3078265 RepID=UPI0028E739E0|nr:MFS transporter [Sphingomonas sp. Y38-1Y]